VAWQSKSSSPDLVAASTLGETHLVEDAAQVRLDRLLAEEQLRRAVVDRLVFRTVDLLQRELDQQPDGLD
jgi:hypothetical protein